MASKAVVTSVRAVAAATKRAPLYRAPLTLTPAAVKKIKEIMSGKPDMIALRIGVKTRGCNGLSYTLDYSNQKGKFDEVIEQDGVKIFMDTKAQLTLLGTEMDYVESKLSSEFIFNNPNVKGTCGCGESFNV
ncbi:ISCA1 protein [Octopus vulgaris]|uniref:ISCA1 protein n=2 Tax=Octopus TaxID=6643 RepID=A0AA36FEG1_OCTVU|nr:iron-sulfur cluster assembly 1 homolog, mitochondrial [Octopus sinensis]CAI9736056.1 ISCA1 protein [Octopus vulgaris]